MPKIVNHFIVFSIGDVCPNGIVMLKLLCDRAHFRHIGCMCYYTPDGTNLQAVKLSSPIR